MKHTNDFAACSGIKSGLRSGASSIAKVGKCSGLCSDVLGVCADILSALALRGGCAHWDLALAVGARYCDLNLLWRCSRKCPADLALAVESACCQGAERPLNLTLAVEARECPLRTGAWSGCWGLVLCLLLKFAIAPICCCGP